MKTKKSKEQLKCILTEEELKEQAQLLARKMGELSSLENDLKAVKSQFKSKIDLAKAEASAAASLVQNGYTYRLVNCETDFDPSTGTATMFRNDTGEVVGVRAMTPEERQQKMFQDEEPVEDDTPERE